jgi:serine/threonine protein kinase
VLGNVGYQAPELIGIMDDVDMDAEMNEEGLVDEPFVEQIYSDKLTTKTDIYAYGVVALEVCAGILDYNCIDSIVGLGFENFQGAMFMTNP